MERKEKIFTITQKDSFSLARAGILRFPDGREVKTPAYTIVGTYGVVQKLSPEDLYNTKTQLVIVNTYHMWRILEKEWNNKDFPGLRKHMGWDGVLMTDSGGFQVLSLGAGMKHGSGKIAFPGRERKKPKEEEIVSITSDGIAFKDERRSFNGFLTPEKSIEIQEKLNADITFVLDECTSPLHDYKYTRQSLSLSNSWALRSLYARKNGQVLYGIVQGGVFRDLRESSARFLAKQDFDGYGIGGSLGESWEEMLPILDWVVPMLPDSKPRHLLGIGEIHDVFEGVERGIDTFDCIIPTREGRNGAVWTRKGRINGLGKWKGNPKPIDEWCDCKFCKGPEAMGCDEIRNLDKEKRKYVFSYHNVRFFNKIMEAIRESIIEGRFSEFKREFTENIPRRK